MLSSLVVCLSTERVS